MSKGFRNPLKRSNASPKTATLAPAASAGVAAATGTVHISISYDRGSDTAHLLVTDGECTLGEIAKVLLMLRDNAVAEVVRQSAAAAAGTMTPAAAGADKGPG